MAEYAFKLYLTPGVPKVSLCELYGHLELAINDTGTVGALTLLNGLLVRNDTDAAPLRAEDIVIAERDRLLSGIYAYTYGPKIESTVACVGCALPFDLDFYLRDLEQHTLSS